MFIYYWILQSTTNALSDLCDVQKLFMQCLEGYPSNITHAGFADYKGNIVMVSFNFSCSGDGGQSAVRCCCSACGT